MKFENLPLKTLQCIANNASDYLRLHKAYHPIVRFKRRPTKDYATLGEFIVKPPDVYEITIYNSQCREDGESQVLTLLHEVCHLFEHIVLRLESDVLAEALVENNMERWLYDLYKKGAF